MAQIKDKVVSLEILKVAYDELKELNSTKLSLPTDSEGNALTGTSGQVLVSDGKWGNCLGNI